MIGKDKKERREWTVRDREKGKKIETGSRKGRGTGEIINKEAERGRRKREKAHIQKIIS